MEEDGDEQEQSGDVGVKQGRKRHRRIAREEKGQSSGSLRGH